MIEGVNGRVDTVVTGYCTVVMCQAFFSMCYVAVTEVACLMCIQIKGYIQSKLLQRKTP